MKQRKENLYGQVENQYVRLFGIIMNQITMVITKTVQSLLQKERGIRGTIFLVIWQDRMFVKNNHDTFLTL